MITFTGDLRCDFEKATAEIEKQKDRILGYQEKIESLRDAVKKLKKSKEKEKNSIRNLLPKRMLLLKNFKTGWPMRKHFLTMMAAIPVRPLHRRRQTRTRSSPISAVIPAGPKAGRRGTRSHPLRNRTSLISQISWHTLYKMASAAQSVVLQTARLPVNLKSNMNTMSA